MRDLALQEGKHKYPRKYINMTSGWGVKLPSTPMTPAHPFPNSLPGPFMGLHDITTPKGPACHLFTECVTACHNTVWCHHESKKHADSLFLRAHWQPVRNESPFYLKLKGLLWGYRQSLESPFDFSCPRPRHLQDPGSAHSAPAPICQVSASLWL